MSRLNFTSEEDLEIYIKGSVKLKICSLTNECYIEYDEDNSFNVNIDKHKINLINRNKIDPEKYLLRTNQLKINQDKNPIKVISNVILDIFDLVNNSEKDPDSKVLSATLYIKENSSLKIIGDNVKVFLESTKLNALDIDCANVDICGNDYQIKKLNLDTSNLDAKLQFNENNSNINIDANNSKITLFISKGFNGRLELESNNLKIKDDSLLMRYLVNSNLGLFRADMNNGKLKLLSA